MDRVPTRPLDGHLLGHRLHLLEANDIGILLGNPVEQSLAQRRAQAIDVPRSQLHGQNLAVYRASVQSSGPESARLLRGQGLIRGVNLTGPRPRNAPAGQQTRRG